MPIAGETKSARDRVASLVTAAGFTPLDLGELQVIIIMIMMKMVMVVMMIMVITIIIMMITIMTMMIIMMFILGCAHN